MTSLEIAKRYFDLSNESNFDEISKLLTENTTYSSLTTGMYLGVEDIISMQKSFHSKFKSLHWTVNSVEEVKPGIILFNYNFTATDNPGVQVKLSGSEYVVVKDGKIQHIEIRSSL